MTLGLVRYQESGNLHFITFSCYQRRPFLRTQRARNLFEETLERMRQKHDFFITGYVIMPEHVHLLLSEPRKGSLAISLHAIKLSMSKQSPERPFWQARYYDFNVYTEKKRVEKLRYMHRNPVKRGLVEKAEEWQWSSFQHYFTGEPGVVEIESPYTAAKRDRALSNPP